MKNTIHAFKNADKSHDESWTQDKLRDIGNFPHPFRALLIGMPNCGKTTLAMNLVCHQKPAFEQVVVIYENEAGREWDPLEPTFILSELPDIDYWVELRGDEEEPPKKILCVLDDVEMTSADKEKNRRLAMLFRYVSSHCFLSVMFLHQSWFDVPPIVKKCANIYVVWKARGRDETEKITNRVGLPKGTLVELFKNYAKGPRDSICIDFTLGSPQRLRLNIWQPINLVE